MFQWAIWVIWVRFLKNFWKIHQIFFHLGCLGSLFPLSKSTWPAQGTTIGEKLKSASPNSFKTLDQAWRAHRVRNEIAHAGSDFVLTKKAAQDTITQYKMVFEEFELL